ncbi:hypothetical protein WMY93_000861 [Mugilogobius chulae]|uniref:Homeobox domain-containing protein n=1 Tax=Mugilogobius chulae TaxID=88201 RepID=A0AAW0Q213_9GOBI
MAIELKKRGVVSVSLWPGAVQTELISQFVMEKDAPQGIDPKTKDVFINGETTELSGKCIVNLAKDKNLMSLTGKILMTSDLARRYGIQDIDGRKVCLGRRTTNNLDGNLHSSLPPPQDSYYYHSPEDKQEPLSEPTTNISETHAQQNRQSRYRKSKSQLAVLRKSFLRENWPSESELRRLQEETGLSRNDIRKWFSDSRYQLRVGRGSLAAAQGFSHNTGIGLKPEKNSVTPPFVSQKHHEPNGASVHEEPQSNGVNDSDFFQKFLSNSLEAIKDKVFDSEELSRDSEDSIKDEQEQPLQLTKQCKTETDVLQEPSNLRISPKSPPPGNPLSSFSPVKRHSNGISTSKKSVHSTKTSPSQTLLNASVASTSPSLTPAGRPRKTKEQLDVLKQYFLRCQWPKGEEYTELVKLTGLPRADVCQWFGDTRYALKNGQLRWVKGVRDQLLAELNSQQNVINGSSPRTGGSRKQKSPFPDVQPLVTYYHTTGLLQEKDLDSLCKKSNMSYQQVRDWFAAQDSPDQSVVMD